MLLEDVPIAGSSPVHLVVSESVRKVMLKRIMDMFRPVATVSGDMLEGPLFRHIMERQGEGQPAFRCSFCGRPHVFLVPCHGCNETLPAATAMFNDSEAVPGFTLVAAYCEACGLFHFDTLACPNVKPLATKATLDHTVFGAGGPSA